MEAESLTAWFGGWMDSVGEADLLFLRFVVPPGWWGGALRIIEWTIFSCIHVCHSFFRLVLVEPCLI